MTELEQACLHRITTTVKQAGRAEGVSAAWLSRSIAAGRAVLPRNRRRSLRKPCAIGAGLRTKVNANVGTSPERVNLLFEIKKLRAALECGADAVMDLSVGGNLPKIRQTLIAESSVPLGTVPVYEVSVKAQKKYGDCLAFDKDDVLEVILRQAQQGVDFFTVHCGVTRQSISQLKKKKRLLGIVSRGGALLAGWMVKHKQENPFFEYFDRILSICADYDVTLSLGDGLRPGSIFDATDPAQIEELKILGKLALRARRKHVQVMIEGPGHVPLDQIRENIALEKKICHQAPFYVLGPLVTDVAAGYDHITSAIGGALAASYGADFLCYVTPSEHLRLPSVDDVREGVIASRIAAHAADIVKRVPGADSWDRAMTLARRKRDWKKQIALSIDPTKAARLRASSTPQVSDVCTMCGQFCSIKMMERYFK